VGRIRNLWKILPFCINRQASAFFQAKGKYYSVYIKWKCTCTLLYFVYAYIRIKGTLTPCDTIGIVLYQIIIGRYPKWKIFDRGNYMWHSIHIVSGF